MSEVDPLLIDATTKIFEDLSDPQTLNSATTSDWRSALWSALEESGLTLAWVPTDNGGSGASLADGFSILELAGKFAVPIPLGETLLAGWLLSKSDLDCPSGMMTVAPSRPRDKIQITEDNRLEGKAFGIPFANVAENIVVLAYKGEAPHIAQVSGKDCVIKSNPGQSGDGRDTITFSNTTPIKIAPAPEDFSGQEFCIMGATIRSMQISGALQSILKLATDYAQERVAFEKQISKFQAVQHNLAKLASETAVAIAAAGSAMDTINTATQYNELVFFEAASAKIRTGESVGEAAAIAHQVHGAIGFTEEHILHRYTQRLWDWRDDFGSESEWAVELGEMVAERGADELWPLLTAR